MAHAQTGEGPAGPGAVPALDLVSALVGAAVVSIVVGLILFVRTLRGRPREAGVDLGLASTLLRQNPGAMLTWVGRELRFFCGDNSPFAEVRGSGEAPPTMAEVAGAFTETDGVRLQDAAVRLRESGRAFDLRLSGRADEADFLAIGRRITAAGESLDAVWFVDISELARRTRKQQREIEALNHAHRAVVGLLDSLAFPAWVRAPDLKLTYVNPAYARAVDQRDAASAVREQREIGASLLGEDGRDLARQARKATSTQTAESYVVLGGKRRFIRFIEHPLADGYVAGIAIDRTDINDVREDLSRHQKAHAAVLQNLAVPIVMFAADGHLTFNNRTYAELWGLEQDWLDQGPSLGEVLEMLREKRKVPEYADFPAFKREQMRLFQTLLAPQEDLQHLPDGTTFRRVVSPHPLGGLIFSYEDVTDRLAIERNYNTSVAVHRETLANMHEGIAVYGSDGRLKLHNRAFANLWQLGEEQLNDQPHVRDVIASCRSLLESPRYDDYDGDQASGDQASGDQASGDQASGDQASGDRASGDRASGDQPRGDEAPGDQTGAADEVLDQVMQRRPAAGTIERSDGTLLDYAAVPLPDGNLMLSYVDVTDSVRAARALEERAEALEAADRLKSEFLATVSYELRTPLNAIIGFSEILENCYFGTLNDRQMEYTHDILDASNRLLALIDDILDLASIEAGRVELEREPVRISALIDSVAAVTREWARKQGLEIEIDCPRNVGTVRADEGRIKQVLFNLVTNAIKFTPSGGRVTLAARRKGDWMHVSVIDTGIGIDEESRDAVFDKFARVHAGSRTAGPGLGLSLVKSVVELHGGRVAVDDNPGGGMIFTCILPLDQAAGPGRPRLSIVAVDEPVDIGRASPN